MEDYVRCQEIRQLMDDTIAVLKKKGNERFREWQIFVELLGDTPETAETFLKFLHNVSTCPPEIIQWCQKQVNPARR